MTRWQEISDLLEEIQIGENNGTITLTEWENDFFDSASMQFSSKEDLTDKQINVLKDVLDR